MQICAIPILVWDTSKNVNGMFIDSTEEDIKLMRIRLHILHPLLSGCVQRLDVSAFVEFLPKKNRSMSFILGFEKNTMNYKLVSIRYRLK